MMMDVQWYHILRYVDITQRIDTASALSMCNKSLNADVSIAKSNIHREFQILQDVDNVTCTHVKTILEKEFKCIDVYCSNHTTFSEIPQYWQNGSISDLYSLSSIHKAKSLGLRLDRYHLIVQISRDLYPSGHKSVEIDIRGDFTKGFVLTLNYSLFKSNKEVANIRIIRPFIYSTNSIRIGNLSIDIPIDIPMTYDIDKKKYLFESRNLLLELDNLEFDFLKVFEDMQISEDLIERICL
jgi:hypothetical protein